ncbi:non-canonical (house-cleaning) NTP pyrophosphatase [Caldalkalibacillus uzonensis]|uniref:inosine/xanthosine triphosphatase n=1 Tax=Caldalkalibacillus uzonensis TaxID=353224 RepID=A0ABU0CN43_9BACI|nr:DUF84 family protein [Caldalkalibacillus uzonensis]MDQ0337572.1 non-canonical (house-cleaning) NTP pyrophosphatase [Caldalkalibacillus uzonensis]
MIEHPLHMAVGTISSKKLEYLNLTLGHLGLEAELYPVNVNSGVSEQPLSSAETKKGSLLRARHALQVVNRASCAIGIEIGYERDEQGRYHILGWATIIDRKDRQVAAQSQPFLLPRYHHQILTKGLPLGEFVDDYVRQSMPHTQQQYMAAIIRDRRPFIKQAIEAALLQYVNYGQFFDK